MDIVVSSVLVILMGKADSFDTVLLVMSVRTGISSSKLRGAFNFSVYFGHSSGS